MSHVFLSIYFEDPDWPNQIVLIKLAPSEILPTGMVRCAFNKLNGEEPPSEGLIMNAAFRKEGGAEVQATHGSLRDTQEGAITKQAREEISAYRKIGEELSFAQHRFDQITPGALPWMTVQLAWKKENLYSDSFEGL